MKTILSQARSFSGMNLRSYVLFTMSNNDRQTIAWSFDISFWFVHPAIRPETNRQALIFPHCIGSSGVTGGGERDRTDDPLLAKQVLSQLSYTPMTIARRSEIVAAQSCCPDAGCTPRFMNEALGAAIRVCPVGASRE